MKFTLIPWKSDLYDQEIQLRDAVLRAPLGLSFENEDMDAEVDQFHFGVVDDQLVACVLGVKLSPDVVKLRQMAVTPDRQKQGIGAMLLKNAEQHLAKEGFKQIELNARLVAVGFYEKSGYHKQGDEFIEVSVPHYKMTKQIG